MTDEMTVPRDDEPEGDDEMTPEELRKYHLLDDGVIEEPPAPTDDLGDLNRLYPGDPNGLPMARMAYEITETLREFHTTHALDLHESWAFYRDRTETQTGTAFLGQTVSSSTARGLELGRHGEVDDGAARRADEVVVVLGEVLGELVARELVARDDAPHDAGRVEHGEVAVRGALGQPAIAVEELGDGEGPIGGVQRIDERPPVAGVALAVAAQPGGDGVVQVGGRHRRRLPAKWE